MRSKISSKLRAQILAECKAPGAIITAISAKHNIPAGRIYNWRGNIKKLNRQKSEISASNKPADFVEISIKKESSSNIFLKKASFELQDFSLTIKGSIDNIKLLQLIELLSVKC